MAERLTLTPEAARDLLQARIGEMAGGGKRRLLVGIAGGPGAGKSTLAGELVGALNAGAPGSAALVPMDGFHMRQSKLEALGLAALKGAPQTFEAAAFIAFLGRLKTADGPVAGPGYSRAIEEVVEDAYHVAPETRVLVAEGNYLLLDDPPWTRARDLIDLAVFLRVPRERVRARLLARHAEHGLFTQDHIRAHVEAVDLPNHDRVAGTADRADLVIDLVTAR